MKRTSHPYFCFAGMGENENQDEKAETRFIASHEKRQSVVSLLWKNSSLLVTALLVISLVLGWWVSPEVRQFLQEAWSVWRSGEQNRIQEWVEGLGWYGPLGVVLLMVVQMFLLVIPSWLLMIIAVKAYGMIGGSVLAIVAVFTASTVGYFIGRYVSRLTIYRLLGRKKEEHLEQLVDKYGVGVVFLFRLAPFLSNDAISFVGGMVGMSYGRFIGATLAGITPLAILIAWIGQDNELLRTVLLWGTGVSAVGFGIYWWWQARFR